MLSLRSLVVVAALQVALASTRGISQRPIKFQPPFKAINPNQYANIYDSFKSCVASCTQETSYAAHNNDAWTAFNSIGGYTACATTCVANEALNTLSYFKSTYALIYDVYAKQLELTKKYLAGGEEFDLIGNRTHIDYSCCLPNEYFVPWDQVSVEVFAYFEPRDRSFVAATQTNNNGISVNVRAEKYLSYCAQTKDGADPPNSFDFNYLNDATGTGGLRLYCDEGLYHYLSILKRNIGHEIVHPDYAKQIPNGACTKRTNCNVSLKPNPTGKCFDGTYCVVEKTHIVNATGYEIDSDDRYSYLTDLIVTAPNAAGRCDPIKLLWDASESYWLELNFLKVSGGDLDLFKVSGLPRFQPTGLDAGCLLTGTLGTKDSFSFDNAGVPLPWNAIDWYCAEYYQWIDYFDANGKKYENGGVEYCSAQHYANHLTKELFDYTECPLFDVKVGQALDSNFDVQPGNHEDSLATLYGAIDFTPGYSIACLYRIVSLKCDCMRAVVNCYENENQYTSALGQTLGRASSILCGFILCQQPTIYRLFADADGLRHTVIMKEILLQTNLLDATSNASAAAIAFVAFGLGMIAFVATKQVSGYSKSTMEDGYRNLI
ncbi:hypothetical protein ACHHYP_10652 [Achlya hypogyna]|uniref:Secreted protein n=1 Tax=Achlya hypogyna TaxID=1202772 RepID=A0A1V9YKW0_ACHHY|nr:hypothetical protein ACHHYP_10652 [Achlya hypogyna]